MSRRISVSLFFIIFSPISKHQSLKSTSNNFVQVGKQTTVVQTYNHSYGLDRRTASRCFLSVHACVEHLYYICMCSVLSRVHDSITFVHYRHRQGEKRKNTIYLIAFVRRNVSVADQCSWIQSPIFLSTTRIEFKTSQ